MQTMGMIYCFKKGFVLFIRTFFFFLTKVNAELEALLSKFEIRYRSKADSSRKRSGSVGALKWR